MKPPPFAYHDPASVDEAVSLRAEHEFDSLVLAGGQSLVPMLNIRLARPELLIDINRIEDLRTVRAPTPTSSSARPCASTTSRSTRWSARSSRC